jgi:hypothetical protein
MGQQKRFIKREVLLASRPAVYIFILCIAAVMAYAYKLRAGGIFACQGNGYPFGYLASCNGDNYGDFEHGAFWFNMEPAAVNSARNADALFVGNSRTQIAFSTPVTAEWFSSLHARYYLLGFSYDENVTFTELLLKRIHARPQVYVVNVDSFFSRYKTPPAKVVTEDPQARSRYQVKRRWQLIHKPICATIPAVCGHKYAVFRSRETGAYSPANAFNNIKPVSYDPVIDQRIVNTSIVSAKEFLSGLDIQRECIILTIVPYVGTRLADANAIANAVGLKLISPGPLDGLQTMDGFHLDMASAERWSRAFFQTAGAQIQKCLQKSQESRS